jgi:hypothetical protein
VKAETCDHRDLGLGSDRREHDLHAGQRHDLDAGGVKTKRPARNKLAFQLVEQSLTGGQVEDGLQLDGSILLHGPVFLVVSLVSL